jgi:hypothetical protein
VDGGPGWEPFRDGEIFPTNPRLLVGEEERAMLRVWALSQGGFGVGHLPDDGGILEQASITMDALDAMHAARAQLEKKKAPR